MCIRDRGREVKVTSSTIPIVKWFFGIGIARFSNTERICAGVVSLEPRPVSYTHLDVYKRQARKCIRWCVIFRWVKFPPMEVLLRYWGCLNVPVW